jgi:two-component system, OmpR family, KDP operon response regulator KdpE
VTIAAQQAVLVIDDEPQIRRLLHTAFQAEGYRVIEAANGQRGLVEAGSHKPDLAIVDLGLPDMDGAEVIRRIREWSAMPLIVLSARTQEAQKIAALDAGADDYVTKPFGVGELLARMRVALRHATRRDGGGASVMFGDIEIDLAKRQIRAPGRDIHLTPVEFRLLTCLVRHEGMVVTHRHLLREVWGPSHVDQPQYLRVYMKQLRQKLEPDPVRPRHLLTETGVGYRLVLGEGSS